MTSIPITMRVGDELPAWQPTITVDGIAEDYTAGHTFAVVITDHAGTELLNKTEGITGQAAGTVLVEWAPAELAIATGTHRMRLTITRTADDRSLSIDALLRLVA